MGEVLASIALKSRTALTTPQFFPSASAFRAWLLANAASAPELLVGFHKVGSGLLSMSWSESVDEALCFGWIDGVRRRIDDAAYSIRFTPRRRTSIWSAVNIAKFEHLQAQGRMTVAGFAAFSHCQEQRSAVYSYEQGGTADLSAQELQAFMQAPAAWAFFQVTPPGYKKVVLNWISAAKKAQTRAARFAKLLQASESGQRLR